MAKQHEFSNIRLDLTRERKRYFSPLYEALKGYAYTETGKWQNGQIWGEFDVVVTDYRVNWDCVEVLDAYGLTPDGAEFELTQDDISDIHEQVTDDMFEIVDFSEYYEHRRGRFYEE